MTNDAHTRAANPATTGEHHIATIGGPITTPPDDISSEVTQSLSCFEVTPSDNKELVERLLRKHLDERERPTIAELEAILAAPTTEPISINPDGSIGVGYVNPDGPEAATLISTLTKERDLAELDKCERGDRIAALSSREAALREETYKQGYRDGFVDAHVDERGPPDEEQILRKMDNVAMEEGWQSRMDTFASGLGQSHIRGKALSPDGGRDG